MSKEMEELSKEDSEWDLNGEIQYKSEVYQTCMSHQSFLSCRARGESIQNNWKPNKSRNTAKNEPVQNK